MTATPPRADLRTLAARALMAATLPGAHPNDRAFAIADAVLAAVLPEHRRMVLAEAADDLHRVATHLRATNPDSSVAKGVRYAEARIWAQLTAAPPAGLSAPVPAETAPAVPEATPDDAPLSSEALALAEHFRSLGCGQVVDPVDLEDCAGMAEEVLRFLGTRGWAAPAVHEEADGQRAGEGDALTYAEMESERDRLARELYEAHAILGAVVAERDDARDGTRRAWLELEHWRTVIVPELMEQRDRLGTDRDRLAAQVAQCQRVVEAAKAWRAADSLRQAAQRAIDIRAAVDALSDAGTDQTEGGRG